MLLCGSFLTSGNYYCKDYFGSTAAFEIPIRHFMFKPFPNVRRPNNVSAPPTACVKAGRCVAAIIHPAEMFWSMSLALRCLLWMW